VTHADPASLRIVTYNIHRSRGMDRRTQPERIAAVLRTVNADVIALQEVIGAGPAGRSHIEEIGAMLGMGWVMAPTRALRGHQFGNAVLSRLPITHHSQYDLSWKACEERGLQRVAIDVRGRTLNLFNVHLGTAVLERRYQAERLAALVCDRHVHGPRILLGDFNEWVKGRTTALLRGRLKSLDLGAFLKRRRTYPGLFPVLHLDHIYYAGALEIVGIELPRTRLSLVASDHLPLVADLRLGG
jgi:endonuclease/exonuclease/phosphatase family metal-dependent hydrolase